MWERARERSRWRQYNEPIEDVDDLMEEVVADKNMTMLQQNRNGRVSNHHIYIEIDVIYLW